MTGHQRRSLPSLNFVDVLASQHVQQKVVSLFFSHRFNIFKRVKDVVPMTLRKSQMQKAFNHFRAPNAGQISSNINIVSSVSDGIESMLWWWGLMTLFQFFLPIQLWLTCLFFTQK